MKDNNILIKFKYNKNFYYDIYLTEENNFSIIFNFSDNYINKIKLTDIIKEINTILEEFDLKVGSASKINNINEFQYYNNNNYIKFNNKNDINCSKFNLQMNYQII